MSYKHYPDIDDPFFNRKIVLKKEFFIHRSGLKSDNDMSDSDSQNDTFLLTSMQNILKNYISPKTPYNGVLVYHGTGVGKTCTSITIAEQFKYILEAKDKRILVVLSPSLRKNFIKQLFDIHRVLFTYRGNMIVDYKNNQCTDYLKEIDVYGLTPEEIHKKIKKLIHKYYQFFGYTELSNYIDRLITYSTKGILDPVIKNEKRAGILKKYFSDRVIIMDEIHSIRSIDNVIDTNLIVEMIQSAVNNKLILLTATPIYNDPKEIIFLLNLLLANDKRELLTPDMLFNKENNLTREGKSRLIEYSRGYISYLKGSNPYYFPIKLYPDDNHIMKKKDFPTYDIKGHKIAKQDVLKSFRLVNCFMDEGYQYTYYKLGLERMSDKRMNDIDSDIIIKRTDVQLNQNSYSLSNNNQSSRSSQSNNNSSQSNNNSNQNENDIKLKNIKMNIQVSNIVFPSDNASSTYYGRKGFLKYFEMSANGKSFKIRKNMMDIYGNILDEKILHRYSTKMAQLLEYIKNARGIVYIYSDYIWSGVLPLALILEYNGYVKYGDTQLLEGEKLPQRTIHKGSTSIAKYILLSGNSQISPHNDNEIDICTRDNNREGETVKIILGSPLAGEGIDLKRIREVHILDPWYHDKKLEQIIGRAVRYKSHHNLPEKYRNVTIYQYVANLPKSTPDYKKGIESLDLRVYRIAENKGYRVKQVEKVLQNNAFDCNLNIYENNLMLDNVVKITTSQGENIKYNDREYKKKIMSNHNNDENNEYDENKCYPYVNIDTLDKTDIDTDTYNSSYSTYNIEKIKRLFYNNLYLSIEDIVEKLNLTNSYTDKLRTIYLDDVYNHLHTLVKEKIVFNTIYGKGYLIYRGTHYIFTPLDLNNTRLPVNYRNTRIFKSIYGPKNISLDQLSTIRDKKRGDSDKGVSMSDSKVVASKKKSTEDSKNTDIINKNKLDEDVSAYRNILHSIKKEVESHIHLQKYVNELYQTEFDILDYESQKIVLENLVKTTDRDEIQSTLYDSIKDEYILFTDYINDTIKQQKSVEGEIYGYMILNRDSIIEYYYYDRENNTFQTIGELVKNKIKRTYTRIFSQPKNDIFGYTIYDKKKNKKLFKIIDNRNVKVEEIKIKKAEKTGFVCIAASNFKIEDCRNIITLIDADIIDTLSKIKKKQNKDSLCYIIEILLRYRHNNTNISYMWRQLTYFTSIL